jgi:hypothetical protein
LWIAYLCPGCSRLQLQRDWVVRLDFTGGRKL